MNDILLLSTILLNITLLTVGLFQYHSKWEKEQEALFYRDAYRHLRDLIYEKGYQLEEEEEGFILTKK